MDANKVKSFFKSYFDKFKPQACPFCGEVCVTYWMKMRIEGSGKKVCCGRCGKTIKFSSLLNSIVLTLKWLSYVLIPLFVIITRSYLSGIIILLLILAVISFIGIPFSKIETVDEEK